MKTRLIAASAALATAFSAIVASAITGDAAQTIAALDTDYAFGQASLPVPG